MSQSAFIRRTLYDLKRRYPTRIELYEIVESEVDSETGSKTVDKIVYTIKRAILLPKHTVRAVMQLLGESRRFQYGGIVEQDLRTVIIDPLEYPKNYSPRPKDYVIIDHERYTIVDVGSFDSRLAIIMSLRATKGEEPAAIIEQRLDSRVDLNSGTAVEP